MRQPSSVSRPSTSSHVSGRAVLECAPPATDPSDQLLRIRAERVYAVTPDDLFESWTRRTAWEAWMRLRARSRATLSPYRGGAFRLELAEGPTIHVITGTVMVVHPPDLLSLSWVHHNSSDHGSVIDVSFREHGDDTLLTVVHRSIASRREAAWLMRLWNGVLDRIGHYVGDRRPSSLARVTHFVNRRPGPTEPEARRRHGGRPAGGDASSAA